MTKKQKRKAPYTLEEITNAYNKSDIQTAYKAPLETVIDLCSRPDSKGNYHTPEHALGCAGLWKMIRLAQMKQRDHAERDQLKREQAHSIFMERGSND